MVIAVAISIFESPKESVMIRSICNAALAATLMLVSACHGASSEPVAPGNPPATWSKDLTKQEKVAFMKRSVVPAMSPVFQAHDPTRYARFGCITCHGPQNKDPHDFLPKRIVKDGVPTAFAEKPEIAKFMAMEVVPKMAGALGVAPFDVKTKEGFGCAGCHAMDMQ